ncbi:MAG: phosphoenolpyruvate carboxykinase (GTP) [Thermoplasmata archaeon]|nr:MAG: phosphoenolpyruvate carboxykinase (GTP) [Thermoplasmata archaeon]
MQERSYFTLSLPKAALDEIKEYVALNKDLYNSHIEFCVEAIRRRLDEIYEEMLEKEKMKNLDIVARADAIRKKLDEIIKKLPKQNREEIEKLKKRITKK